MKYIITLILLSSFIISAQDKAPTREEFKNNLSKLENEKALLLKQKIELEQFIKSSEERKTELDRMINECIEKKVSANLSRLIKKYGKEVALMISAGKIWKGMSIEMLKDSWGKPDSINQDTFSYGKFAQLRYGDVEFFFRDNLLIDWEEKK